MPVSYSLTSKIDVNINTPYSRTSQITGVTTVDQLTILKRLADLTFGSSAGQINKEFYESSTQNRTYQADGSVVVWKDLYTGDVLVFSYFKVFYLFNSGVNSLTVSGTNPGWGSVTGGTTNTTVHAGGSLLVTSRSGYAFSGTNQIVVSGTSPSFDVVILGH